MGVHVYYASCQLAEFVNYFPNNIVTESSKIIVLISSVLCIRVLTHHWSHFVNMCTCVHVLCDIIIYVDEYN